MIFEPGTVTDASGSTERQAKLYSEELRINLGLREKKIQFKYNILVH
jgi:hypothetical protein